MWRCYRVEHQRVDRRRLTQAKLGVATKIEVDQAMTQDKGFALCQIVKEGQRLIHNRPFFVVEEEGLTRTGCHCAKEWMRWSRRPTSKSRDR